MPLLRATMAKFLSEIVTSGRVVRVKRLVLIRDRFINRALLRYEHFCTSCKKIVEEYFVENLFVFSRVRNW